MSGLSFVANDGDRTFEGRPPQSVTEDKIGAIEPLAKVHHHSERTPEAKAERKQSRLEKKQKRRDSMSSSSSSSSSSDSGDAATRAKTMKEQRTLTEKAKRKKLMADRKQEKKSSASSSSSSSSSDSDADHEKGPTKTQETAKLDNNGKPMLSASGVAERTREITRNH